MDDWKITHKLDAQLSVLRWDYDSKFNDKTEFSPRLGFAWSHQLQDRTARSWGLFYDQFRLGIARDVPGFGGANLQSSIQPLSYPRLFSGSSHDCPRSVRPMSESDAHRCADCAAGTLLPVSLFPRVAIYGVDHLNNVVAPGHAPIPINSVVNLGNIQQLSGLDPTTYLNDASLAIGQQPGICSGVRMARFPT